MQEVIDEPIGYTDPGMDQEMNFPNPVERHDLPVKKRRWPRLLVLGLIVAILGTVFLPKVLSSKVGRKIVVSYISGKVNGTVTLESFQTSWFGDTTVRFLSIADPMGRRIGFKSLTCKAGLWRLLRGKYQLGDTVIDGLNVDYVVDDGRGADTVDQLKGPAAATAGGPSTPGILSGKITINSGTLTLFRGTVQPKLFNTTWEQARLENLEATVEIEGADKPWKYTVVVDTVDENQPRGTITSKGTVMNGRPVEATFVGENIGTGPLGAAFIPGATAVEVRQVLGPVLKNIEVVVKQTDGVMNFEKCEVQGDGAKISMKPALDLSATPAVWSLEGASPGVISVGVSKRLASGVLVYLSPFFREAASGRGNVTVTVESLKMPLGRQWMRTLACKGSIATKDMVLDRKDEMSATQTTPDNLASQVALLTGDSANNVPFEVRGGFEASGGDVAVSGMQTKVGEVRINVEGKSELVTGNLKLNATVEEGLSMNGQTASGAALAIGGTVKQPMMDVWNLKSSLAESAMQGLRERMEQQVARMRSREIQVLMEKSQNKVKEILRPLQGPATLPVK